MKHIILSTAIILVSLCSFGQQEFLDTLEFKSIHSTDTIYTKSQKQYMVNDYLDRHRDSLVCNLDSAFRALPFEWRNSYETKILLLYRGASDTTKRAANNFHREASSPYKRINHYGFGKVIKSYSKLGFPDKALIRYGKNIIYKPQVTGKNKAEVDGFKIEYLMNSRLYNN